MPAGILVLLGVLLGFAALGALLAWFIAFRQARWAAIVLLAWACPECLNKLLAISGERALHAARARHRPGGGGHRAELGARYSSSPPTGAERSPTGPCPRR